jgi:protoporphyrinogen oxidase
MSTPRVTIIGAGPAGLTAAHELSAAGVTSTILEADDVVGGLSRTANYKGYLFDIGGHRFYTRVAVVRNLWKEVLGAELLSRPRLSRIYYRSKFFQYPLDPKDALRKLGFWESMLCGTSFLKSQLFPEKPEDNYETWVSNRFGRRLFRTFFQAYTEKVWGMPCRQISAEWAAQRIRTLSGRSLIRDLLKLGKNRHQTPSNRSLIHEFEYPRQGPGMMWLRVRQIVESAGSRVVLHAPVEKIAWKPGGVDYVVAGGKTYGGTHFISSMPIRQLIQALDPAPEALRDVHLDFKYRDFITVCLICRDSNLFPDNWIYVQDPDVKVGRIQNYGNWSPDMVPHSGTSSLGLEYFCFEGDGLWQTPDAELIDLGRREVEKLGLVQPGKVTDGCVLRMKKAYPVYDSTYTRGLEKVREFLRLVPNLQLVGRNGMHKYNNQDHSMLTAMLAARNILGANYDLWRVNSDAEYNEEGGDITDDDLLLLEESQPLVPTSLGSY